MSRTPLKLNIPIVVKIVILTSVLVVAVSLILAIKNAQLFSQISRDREEANAEGLVSSKALEVEAILESYTEKLTLLALEKDRTRSLTGDLVYVKYLGSDQSRELSAAGLPEDLLATFREQLSGFKSEEAVVKAGSLYLASTGNRLKTPFLVVGTPVARDDGAVTHWAWGFFKLDRLQASFESKGNLKVYLLDARGMVIVHPEEKLTLQAANLSNSKIIASLLKEDIRQRQQYIEGTLYSSSKTVHGPLVVGEVVEMSIMAPAQLARDTSYYLLGVILSMSFFVSFVFAQRLSRNIEKLTAFAHRIAQGDFNVEASKEIRSKDEVGQLAIAFDDMTMGLQERDKIKNMFTKFHGTAVTDQLMSQEDLRKGQEREAVVFFSDIRGFTTYSNDRSAEEVVGMLNSYFEVMVTIITKHGGVVDKFVGDAIMAVWGAPASSEDDVRNAMNACLEMRLALADFNQQRLEDGKEAITMGMGLHVGPVVAGTVGSHDRLEYTVIGDTVNTASRIESATKQHGTDLLISESVAQRLNDEFILRNAGETVVKGKSRPLKLATVLGRYAEDGTAQLIVTPYSQYEAEADGKAKKSA